MWFPAYFSASLSPGYARLRKSAESSTPAAFSNDKNEQRLRGISTCACACKGGGDGGGEGSGDGGGGGSGCGEGVVVVVVVAAGANETGSNESALAWLSARVSKSSSA